MDIVSPLVGLAGVMVGASVQWFAATRNQRTQFNIQATNETKAYLVRALKAADMLHLVHGLVVDEFLKVGLAAAERHAGPTGTVVNFNHSLSAELGARLEEATAEWRSVLTIRYLLAPEPVSSDLTALDETRGKFAELVLSGDIAGAKSLREGLEAAQVARLKLGSGVAAARANIVLSRSFLPWWNRTERKAVFATYVAQATKYNDESTSS